MPDKAHCRYCNRVGFIRIETVVKGGNSIRSVYCGACDRTWETADDGTSSEVKNRRNEPPDRSRNR